MSTIDKLIYAIEKLPQLRPSGHDYDSNRDHLETCVACQFLRLEETLAEVLVDLKTEQQPIEIALPQGSNLVFDTFKRAIEEMNADNIAAKRIVFKQREA